MRKDLVSIIACPVCREGLELHIFEGNDSVVIKGSLTCRNCATDYPIQNSIPNLLPPDITAA